jgi:hypothetical protein
MTDLPHGPDITKESAQTMDNEDLLELAEKNCQTIYELAEHRGLADDLKLDVVPRNGLKKQTKGSFASVLGLESNREKFKEASADVSDRERAELLLQQNAINLSLIS